MHIFLVTDGRWQICWLLCNKNKNKNELNYNFSDGVSLLSSHDCNWNQH